MDVFEHVRQEMDTFIETVDHDSNEYYLAITGRLFVPNRYTSPQDVETFIGTSRGFYDEIGKKSDYDVSGILETLDLILKLNNHFR